MYKRCFKRLLDIFFSLILLIVLSPLLLVISILVKLNVGSPILFSQYRPGLKNRIFKLYKFRSMSNEKDSFGNLLPDDKRLSRFGKWLRATSLDELPELFNILIGDMSFVGPRPQLVKDLVFMTDGEKHRHDVLPGLTGLAQVNGRNGIDWKKRFEYDLSYIRNITFIKDFKIIIKTFIKVFEQEGITESDMVTSMDYGDYLLVNHMIKKDDYDKKIELCKKLLEGM